MKNIPLKFNSTTEYIINTLNAQGYQAFVVGGCVRDYLMGREITDIDITTSALPNEVKNVFSSYTIAETGIKHGTITVIINNQPYEITTFRTESNYTDSRHPDKVNFVSDINQDLSRRDFTMNAIAYSQNSGIIDPYFGIKDIESKIIRTVGDPFKRFSEDALRILRALRFSSVLGFEIESETAKAINQLAPTLTKISPERIYSELKKLILGKNAREVINRFLTALSPIVEIKGEISSLSDFPLDFPMRLTYLCGEDTSEILKNLRADNETKKLCELLLNSNPIPTETDKVKLFISNYGRESAAYISNYRRIAYGEDLNNLVNNILSENLCLTVNELAINGEDLINIGINGKQIGETLKKLLKQVIQGVLPNTKQALIFEAKGKDK